MGFDIEQSSEKFNINLSNQANYKNQIENQLPQLGRTSSDQQIHQHRGNFQQFKKLSSWRDGLVQGHNQNQGKFFSQAFQMEQNLGGDNAMNIIRSSMQSNTARQIQDLGVGAYPNYNDQHTSKAPQLGASRSGVLGQIAKNELMKTQESINFAEQRLLEQNESQNLQKTLQKPKQLQPLLQMNYQSYRQIAQNVFNDTDDVQQSANSLEDSPYRRENQICIKLQDGSYIKVDQQVEPAQGVTQKIMPLVQMTPSDELISNSDLGSGRKMNQQQFFNSSVKDSTDSLINKLQGGAPNQGNFTINAKSIRIVNKNYFNDSNGMQQAQQNFQIQQSLQKQPSEQEQKPKKLIRIKSQKIEPSNAVQLKTQEKEQRKLSRNEPLANQSKPSSRESSRNRKIKVSSKNVVTNLVQKGNIHPQNKSREIQTPNFNEEIAKDNKINQYFTEQRPKLSVKFQTSNLGKQNSEKQNFLARVQSFQNTDQNSSNAQSNCKRSSNEETSYSQSQSGEIPFLENMPLSQRKGGPIIKLAHHKSEEIGLQEKKRESPQIPFQKKSSFKLPGSSTKKKVLFMHQVATAPKTGKNTSRAEENQPLHESIKEEPFEEGKEPDYSGTAEVANLTFGFGDQ